jgi:hypothetical protein
MLVAFRFGSIGIQCRLEQRTSTTSRYKRRLLPPAVGVEGGMVSSSTAWSAEARAPPPCRASIACGVRRDAFGVPVLPLV